MTQDSVIIVGLLKVKTRLRFRSRSDKINLVWILYLDTNVSIFTRSTILIILATVDLSRSRLHLK